MKTKIKFKNLDTNLKILVIYAWVSLGLFTIGFIIGVVEALL